MDQAKTVKIKSTYRYKLSDCESDPVHTFDMSIGESPIQGMSLRRILCGYTGPFSRMIWSPKNEFLVSVDEDRTICIWDVSCGEPLRVFHDWADEGDVSSISWCPDGNTLALTTTKALRIFDIKTREVSFYVDIDECADYTVWSPDGKFLVFCSRNIRIHLFSLNLLTRERSKINCCSEADCMFLGCTWVNTESFVRVTQETDVEYDPPSEEEQQIRRNDPHGLYYGLLSQMGQARRRVTEYLVLTFLNQETGKEFRKRVDYNRVFAKAHFVCISPEKKRVAIYIYGEPCPNGPTLCSFILIYSVANPENCKEVQNLNCNKQATCIAWSPDGKLLSCGFKDGSICIWDTTLGRKLNQLNDHTDCIKSIDFSPEGLLMVTRSVDNSLLFWRTDTWERVSHICDWFANTKYLAWHPDLPRFASTSKDLSKILIWDLNVNTLLAPKQTSEQKAIRKDSEQKVIRIFLASSLELGADRDQFELFFRQENDRLIEEGIYLEILRCENIPNALSGIRKQSDYNNMAKNCDIFVCILKTKTGIYTEEEFNNAYAAFLNSGRPLIFVYFLETCLPNDGRQRDNINSLWKFQDKLKNLGQYLTICTSIEDLKLKFSRELDNYIKENKA